MLDGSPGGSMTAGGSSSSSKHARGHHGHVHSSGQKIKLTPSEVIAHHQNKTSGITNAGNMQQTMQPGGPDATGIKIVQFLNMGLYTHHEGSRVPVGEPLFRPNPPRVEFSEYRALRLRVE